VIRRAFIAMLGGAAANWPAGDPVAVAAGPQKHLLVIVVTNCTGDAVLVTSNGTVICCEGRVKSSALGEWIICS
jgi:hypothetical protein